MTLQELKDKWRAQAADYREKGRLAPYWIDQQMWVDRAQIVEKMLAELEMAESKN